MDKTEYSWQFKVLKFIEMFPYFLGAEVEPGAGADLCLKPESKPLKRTSSGNAVPILRVAYYIDRPPSRSRLYFKIGQLYFIRHYVFVDDKAIFH